MANRYASVRKRWRATDTKKDLEAIWRGERFEAEDAVEGALHVYELAIRVEGWDEVKTWARRALGANDMLHAQIVELAMRAIEQADSDFFEEITRHLLDNAAPQYFRFWHTLFCTRHTHFGETRFRKQLAELSDFHVVKYRRWLRAILRKLRFRCKTDKEKAVAAIAFGMYKTYDRKAYPSDVFRAFIACHDAARTRPKSDQTAKPVTKAKQMEVFTPAAEKLGIWSVTEGIRTSAQLPRTLGYLSAMAPRMTDQELLRGLRAFDAKLVTADHKKASENVVHLAQYMIERLGKLDVGLEGWAKIYPYMASPVLQRVLEDLMTGKLHAHLESLSGLDACPVLIFPQQMEGRAHRSALLASYALYVKDVRSTVLLPDARIRALCHPTALYPYGYGVVPSARRWRAEPDRPHLVLFQLVKETFEAAAKRRVSAALATDRYLLGLRYHLYRRLVLDGGASARDIPVLIFCEEPSKEDRDGLVAHLALFSAAVLLLFDKKWDHPIPGDALRHVTVDTDFTRTLAAIREAIEDLSGCREAFDKKKVDAELRHLHLGLSPCTEIDPVPQGPW